MLRTSITEACIYGSIVLERMALVATPPPVKAALKEFREAHAALKGIVARTDTLRKKRDAAQTLIVVADAKLDAAVRTLADVLVGASLGSRRQPFDAFAPHTPSQLVRMACAKEVRAVRDMCANIAAVSPPAVVGKAVTRCLKRADAVATALGQLSGPQMAFEAAREARTNAVEQWQRSLDRLKKHTAVSLIDDAQQHQSIFARPVAIQTPPTKRRRVDLPTTPGVAPGDRTQPATQTLAG